MYQEPNSQNILGQFYNNFMTFCTCMQAYYNVLIHKTSYDNFMTKILRPFFRCLMTIEISDSTTTFVNLVLVLYS